MDAKLSGVNEQGISLIADRLQVDGDVVMDKITVSGAVTLVAAHVHQLTMADAQLSGVTKEGISLIGDGLYIAGDTKLDVGFTTKGIVRLRRARLSLFRVSLGGLVAATSPKEAALTLDGATVTFLDIDLGPLELQPRRGARPDPPDSKRQGWVSLENCTYTNRPDPSNGSLDDWLNLLRHHTPDYQPRAYQQLAAVHRSTGHDRDAGTILMAQRDHRRATVLRPDDRPGRKDAGRDKDRRSSDPQTTGTAAADGSPSDPMPPANPATYPRSRRLGLWASRAGLAVWKASAARCPGSAGSAPPTKTGARRCSYPTSAR